VLRDVGGADDAAEAVSAVDALVDLARCDGDRVETAEFSTPTDRDTAAAVDDVRRRISAAWAQYHVAHYQPALDLAIQIEADAVALDFTPLSADAAYLLGTTRGRIDRPEAAEAALRRARVLAGRAHLDRLAAEISVQLLRAVKFSGDPERVVELADFVRADLARAGSAEAEVDGIVGEAQLHAGDAASALVAIVSALAAESRPDRRALLLANRASAKLALDDPTGALADYEQAQAIAQAHYGRAHPAVGFFVHRVGRGELAVGDTAAALQTLERALALREQALGPRDRAVASVLVDLAKAAEAAGQRDQARTALARALSIRREVYGDDHPSVADLERLQSQVAAEPE
jgi:tetratricopeptide (TPR) repeat protein